MTASPRELGGYPPGGRDAVQQAVSGPGATVCGLRPFASQRAPWRSADVFGDGRNRIVELHSHAEAVILRTPNGCVRLSPERARALARSLNAAADTAAEREASS